MLYTYLLKDLHGQLRRDRSTRDEFIQRVCERYTDPEYVHAQRASPKSFIARSAWLDCYPR